MGHTINVQYIKKPLPAWIGKWSTIFTVVGLLGVVLMIFTAQDHGQRLAFASNIAFMFTMSIGMGAMFFVALEHLMGNIWSVPFRRIAEILSNVLWIAPIFALPTLLNIFQDISGHGMFNMYHWTHDEVVKNDVFLSQKAPYLNEAAFITRTVVIWLLMIIFKSVLCGNSYKQDNTGSQKINKANAWISALFMLVFAISISLLAIDYMMSLEPHWYSTIFGVYYFAGTFNAAVAFIALLAINFNKKEILIEGLNKDHFYSFGGLMFAFTAFWMYMAFSQFMLIWYANIPEETFWFMPRMKGGWMWLSIGLIFIKFLIPFAMTIQRPAKLDASRLRVAAIWILLAHIYDLYWLMYPTYSNLMAEHNHNEALKYSPYFGWQELSLIILAFGVILLTFNIAGKNRDLVAWNDPKLERGLNFHL